MLFLDTYDAMSIYHLRDLAQKRKTRIKCDDVRVYHAPQYKNIAIKDMLLFAQAYPQVTNALPSEKAELENLHRDYVSTVIYTLVGQPFINWVNQRVEERNDYIKEHQDQMVQLDPEIA